MGLHKRSIQVAGAFTRGGQWAKLPGLYQAGKKDLFQNKQHQRGQAKRFVPQPVDIVR